jgi:hypothetical protein
MHFGLLTKLSASQYDEDWHRNVAATAGTTRPTDVDFPWSGLRKHTDTYVKKNGKLTIEQLADRLSALIERHAAKEIAIAACAHAIPSRTVRELLSAKLYVGPDNYFGLASYLQAIVAANRVRPEAASQSEASWAGELIAQLGGTTSEETLGEQLWRIVSHLKIGVTADSLVCNHIITLTGTVCRDFAALLVTLRTDNRWVDAHRVAGWLSAIPAGSLDRPNGVLGPIQLLDSHLPTWRAWRAWQPNLKRLQFLEEAAINRRGLLHDLLALDGPDFASHGQATLADGLIAQDSGVPPTVLRWENIRIELRGGISNEARSIIDRLTSAIDAACFGGCDFTALLAHLCVGKTITYEVLNILEGVYFIPKPLITVVLNLYTKPRQGTAARMVEVQQLLCPLNDMRTHNLRESMAPYLVNSITDCIIQRHGQLSMQLEAATPWDGTERDLLIFCKSFKNAPWILPLLDASMMNYVNEIINGPSLELLDLLGALRICAKGAATLALNSLTTQIDAYCKAWLVPNSWIDDESIVLVNSLLNSWQRSQDSSRRDLALRVVQYSVHDPQLRYQRLAQIPTLPMKFVAAILTILKDCTRRLDTSLINAVEFLASEAGPEIVGCWRTLVYREFEKCGEQLVDQALENMSARTWLKWLHDVRSVFPDKMEWFSPPLLNPDLHAWSQSLVEVLPTLTRLEETIGRGAWTQCLLKGSRSPNSDKITHLLKLMTENQGVPRQRVIGVILEKLERSGCNAGEIEEALSIVSKTTPKGAESCVSLLEACRHGSPQLAEVHVGVLLQTSELTELDRSALKILARYCDLHLDANGDAAEESFEVAADYLDDRFQELVAEIQRLENLRLSLAAVDPNGVSSLLAKLKIEASSPFDDMLACLPSALADVVERVGDNEVELQFPITNLTKLQERALVVGDSRSFLVRLKFDEKKMPSEYCVHLFNDTNAVNPRKHTPWILSRDQYPPSKSYCLGRPNRATYQLTHILWRHLRTDFKSLELTYAFIVTQLANLARTCVVCGGDHGFLKRSTFCQNPTCKIVFWGASCEILLAEIWHDPTVADLLFTMVHTAAASGMAELLTSCPVNNATTVLKLLAQLPSVGELGKHLKSCLNVYGRDFHLSSSLNGYSFMPDQLAQGLIWACTSYRGFLTTAVDNLRIPSFGQHQFFLANAAPELEIAFAAHIKASQSVSRILFHGTSFDRLHAIVCQGLRVCSGTGLQSHGAARGKGVYLADEPKTAWSYTKPAPGAAKSSGWKHSAYVNHKVLLGCELAGEKPSKDGIHVITDPTKIMLRYIFLMPPEAKMPQAKDVRPAMQSNFASLRSGAL